MTDQSNTLQSQAILAQSQSGYQSRSSKASTAFQRLAGPFIGASRPTSSAGIGNLNLPSTRNVPLSDYGPRSLHYELESQVLAFDANQDRDHVVVAGRDLLKILRIGQEITEESNLRAVGSYTKTTTNNDVKWGNNLKNYIGTASGDGTICIYDLGKNGQLERTFTEHGRSVHKLSFSPQDSRLILSGSQDGNMKLWDTRQKRARCTMMGKSDVCWDVKFNHTQEAQFAAAFENGTLQIWDWRQERIVCKINAHEGPVWCLDWHFDGKRVATGGRDKTVQVWDVYGDSQKKAKHIITTTTGVGCVVWRPQGMKGTELATSAMKHDSRVQIWDIKRPFIPSYILDEHLSAPTCLLWRDENIFWSSSKDKNMKFVQHDVTQSLQPLNLMTFSAFSWNVKDEFTFAIQARGRPKGHSNVRFETEDDTALIGDKRRQSRAPSFKSTKSAMNNAQLELEAYTPQQTVAHVHLPVFEADPWEHMARNYIISLKDNQSLADACTINSRISWEAGKYRTGQTWKILGMVVTWEEEAREKHDARARAKQDMKMMESSSITNKALFNVKGLDIGQNNSAAVTPRARPVADSPKSNLGSAIRSSEQRPPFVETNLSLPPPAFSTSLSSSTASVDGGEQEMSRRSSEPEPQRQENGMDIMAKPTKASEHATSVDNSASYLSDGTVEDTPIMESLESDGLFSPPPTQQIDGIDHTRPISVQADHNENMNMSSSSYDLSFGGGNNKSRQYSFGLISDQTSSSFEEGQMLQSYRQENDAKLALLGHTPGLQAIKEEPVSGYRSETPALATRFVSSAGDDAHAHTQNEADGYTDSTGKPWGSNEIMAQLLDWYCEQGDIQMCATLALLFGDRIDMDDRKSLEWIEGYTDLLRRNHLDIPAAEIAKITNLQMIREKGQVNTHVYTYCHRCIKPITNKEPGTGYWYCERCKRFLDGCVICRSTVKGNWVMCQTCSHGGHDHCLRSWFFEEKMEVCAAVACGHDCLPPVR